MNKKIRTAEEEAVIMEIESNLAVCSGCGSVGSVRDMVQANTVSGFRGWFCFDCHRSAEELGLIDDDAA